MIKAPFNFVPLSEKVFYPPWAEQVSHDIPFSDGESGEIDITITAKSPIFIRNHYVDESDKEFFYTNHKGEKISTEFCYHKNKNKKEYYIPATSVKGMVKNILEIVSFSRIITQNKKFAYRDFDETYYKQKLLKNTDNIHMGWLYNSNGKWCIEDLGKSTKGSNRIKYDDMNLDNKFSIQSQKKAYDKYKLTQYENPTTNDGIIVFTGKVGNEKTREFIFPKSNKDNDIHTYDEDNILIRNFKEAYYVGTPNENDLWKNLFSKRFKDKRHIPVFFLKNEETIESFGLSQLYKLPFKYSVFDGIGEHNNECENIDFADVLFGYSKTNGDNIKSLKGRVSFSHFKNSHNDDVPKVKIQKILSTPRAGYFPMYSKEGNSMDTSYTISGWKRYPVHAQADISDDTTASKAILTYFSPLPSESTFRGKIRFHNLKKVEIGALLFVLSLSNKEDSIYYSMGMAKPYGFGKIKLYLSELSLKYKKDEYIKEFETIMNSDDLWNNEKPFSKWESSEQVKELLSMMKVYNDDYLTYGESNQKGYEYYGDFKRKNNTKKRLNYSHFSEYKENTITPKIRKKVIRTIQVKKLAEQLKVSSVDILKFANEENIDIENEYSFISLDIANMIEKYI